MIIPLLIILDHTLLDAFRSDIKRQMDITVITLWSCQDPELHGIQCTPRITAGHIRKKFKRVVIDHSTIIPHSLITVIDCTQDQRADILLTQSPELKNNRTGEKSTVDLKIRILRRCTDQYDRSILHKRKKIILLSFIKTMDLVDEQNGLLTIHTKLFLRFLYDLLHILLARNRSIDLSKIGTGRIRDHLSKRRLTSPRRPIKNNRSQLIRLDRTI